MQVSFQCIQRERKKETSYRFSREGQNSPPPTEAFQGIEPFGADTLTTPPTCAAVLPYRAILYSRVEEEEEEEVLEGFPAAADEGASSEMHA